MANPPRYPCNLITFKIVYTPSTGPALIDKFNHLKHIIGKCSNTPQALTCVA